MTATAIESRALAIEPAKCGICHLRIGRGEEITRCPECGLEFHADCWMENWGCSAYGCSQVGALELDSVEEPKTVPVESEKPPLPWEYLLLGASVFCAVAGPLFFGVPSIWVAAIGHVAMKRRSEHRNVVILSTLLGWIGLTAGVVVSSLWWIGS